MPVFLGLDCGGSSTRAVAVDSQGTRIFAGQAGAGNLANTPQDQLRRNLRMATQNCPIPDFVCGCFAGLMDDEGRRQAKQLLKEIFPNAAVRAEPDFVATLKACEGTDICVIAGTGSLVCSSNAGMPVKSGGRGYLLGDEGSAYRFGRDALNSYLDAPEKASEKLTTEIENLFGTREPSQVIVRLYRSRTPAGLLAKLVKPLAADAKAGIPYALQSMEDNLLALSRVVKGHVDMYFPGAGSVTMTLAGGLWKSSGMFKQSFALQLSRTMADLELQIDTIKRPPVEGAVELAKEIRIGN